MKAQTKGIDPQAFELAVHFLNGEDFDSLGNRWELAGEIQQAVESWFAVKQLSDGATLADLKKGLESQSGYDSDEFSKSDGGIDGGLSIEQLEALVRKSKDPRWCICADPKHCDQHEPLTPVRRCRAVALKLPISPVFSSDAGAK